MGSAGGTDPTSALLAIAFGLIVGVGSIVLSVAFRSGRRRDIARHYFDEDWPLYVRNLVFGVLPFGVMFLAGVAIIGAFALSPVGSVPIILGGLVVIAFSFWVGLDWIRRPPDPLKPEWLNAEELSRGRPAHRPEQMDAYDRVVLGGSRVVAIALVALAAGLVLVTAVAVLLGSQPPGSQEAR